MTVRQQDTDGCDSDEEDSDEKPAPTSIKRRRSDIEMITDSEESQRVSVTHENQPVIVTVFKDPISQNDRVLALVTLPSGAKDVQFNLSPDGRSAIVDYEWPKLYTRWTTCFDAGLIRKNFKFIIQKSLLFNRSWKNSAIL